MKEAFIAFAQLEGEVATAAWEHAIEQALVAANRDYDHTVKVVASEDGRAVFGKIALDSYAKNCRDPEIGSGVLAVGGYDLARLHDVAKELAGGRYDPNDRDADQRVVRNAFIDFDRDAFALLGKRMPFSAAFFDERSGRFVAARAGEVDAAASESYANLFRGIPAPLAPSAPAPAAPAPLAPADPAASSPAPALLFSNSEALVRQFCPETLPVAPFTCYDSAAAAADPRVAFTSFAEAPHAVSDEEGLRSTYANARDVIGLVNGIVGQAARSTVGLTLDRAFDDYFASRRPADAVAHYVDARIDAAAQARIDAVVADRVRALELDRAVAEEFDRSCRAQLHTYLERNAVPQVNVVTLKGAEVARTSCAYYHEKYEQVLTQVNLDEPVMLVGPAGSGKNYAVSQIAESLGLPMYYTNNASNEFKLTGFIDAGGTYRATEFYKAFKGGGVFFLDEIDNSDPAALIVINSALANGYMAFPHETIKRHPNFRCVAAANTWGKGSNLLYVGRNVLDGATLDRFDLVFFDYDRRLERALYPSEDLLQFLWSFRDAVDACRIAHIVSTRALAKCYKKERAGIAIETILRTNVIRSLSQDDLNIVIGAMKGDGATDRNPYYACLTGLRVSK